MGFIVRKTKTVGGVRLTGSKRGLSASVGAGGARVSSRGYASARILPGLYWRKKIGGTKATKKDAAQLAAVDEFRKHNDSMQALVEKVARLQKQGHYDKTSPILVELDEEMATLKAMTGLPRQLEKERRNVVREYDQWRSQTVTKEAYQCEHCGHIEFEDFTICPKCGKS